MHCDTIGVIYENRLLGNSYSLKENKLHIDIKKMKKADYLLQNFAMFIDIKKYKKPYQTLQEMIDVYYEELNKNKKDIIPVYKYEDILRCKNENKIAALLTIEDSGALECKMERLQEVYERVRQAVSTNQPVQPRHGRAVRQHQARLSLCRG